MAAYVISELEVRDPIAIETYRTIAAKAIAQYGGRYLVRGGAASIAEGGSPPKNIIVVEFPSMGAFARMVRLAGIRRGAQVAGDGARPPPDLRRGRAGWSAIMVFQQLHPEARVRTSRCLLAAVIIGLTGLATPLSAVTVDICKTQWCETSAAMNRAACSELPSNPSCRSLAEDMLRDCHASCEKYPVSEPDPPRNPRGSGGCDPELDRCR